MELTKQELIEICDFTEKLAHGIEFSKVTSQKQI